MKTPPRLRLLLPGLVALVPAILVLILLTSTVTEAQESQQVPSTWDLTFTETVTSSNNPAFTIGEVISGGELSYQSIGSDGTFYSSDWDGVEPQDSNDTLTGTLELGLPLGQQNGVPTDYSVIPFDITQTPYLNDLVVLNGQVVSLNWQDQIGWSDPSFGDGGPLSADTPGAPLTFAFYTGGPQDPPSEVIGTVVFSTPIDPPSNSDVPDGGHTLAMLLVGVAALGLTATTRRVRGLSCVVPLLLLIIALTSVASAQTWDGTITLDVTSSTNAAFPIGSIYTGAFSYESPTADGTFYALAAPADWDIPDLNATLSGTIPIGLPQTVTLQGGQVTLSNYQIEQFSLADTLYDNSITVTDGQVTSFQWQDQIGDSNEWYGFGPIPAGQFLFETASESTPGGVVMGTMTFSAPIDPPNVDVADGITTLPLVLAAFLLIAAYPTAQKLSLARS